MATKQEEQRQDSYRVGYDQPNDPPAYNAPPPGYAPPPPAVGHAYGYPMTQNSTNIIVNQPLSTAMIVPRPMQTDWTLPAILATLFCCLPTGICAIIAAIQARNSYHAGDYEGERSATTWAKGLTITSIVLGSISYATLLILYFTVIRVETNIYNYK